jgi:hypothetical protein
MQKCNSYIAAMCTLCEEYKKDFVLFAKIKKMRYNEKQLLEFAKAIDDKLLS